MAKSYVLWAGDVILPALPAELLLWRSEPRAMNVRAQIKKGKSRPTQQDGSFDEAAARCVS
jgi:hypothetical protein